MSSVAMVEHVDLLHPDTFNEGIPHDTIDAIRSAGIARCWSASNELAFWMLARHEDVSQISRDTESFSSQRNGTILGGRRKLARHDEVPAALTVVDPPWHTFLRKTVHRWFTPRAIAALEERVCQIVGAVIDDVAERGSCDFVADIAGAVPAHVGGMMLGIPTEDRMWIAALGDLVNGAEDPAYLANKVVEPPWPAICAYARDLSGDADGLIPFLRDVEVDGRRMTESEFNWMVFLLVVAANGTTRDALSAGLHALLERPGQQAGFLANPATGAEEVLRWATPVLYFSRTATRDVEMHGHLVQEGDDIALSFAGANFDPSVFERPLEFEAGRRPNPHVTFGGGGPHICLGAHLARLEVRIVLSEVLRRLPDIRLTSEPVRLRSHINNGYAHMPVEWSRALA